DLTGGSGGSARLAGRVRGDEAGGDAGRAERGQLLVRGLAEQRDELRPVGDVQALAADVRVRRRGAPPVQVVPALAPGPAVKLGDRGDQHLASVRALYPVLLAADGQLPADVRLGLQRVPAGAQGQRVQGAALAAGEAGPVEEQAGAVDGPGPPAPVVVADGVPHGDPALGADLVELPVGRRQLLRGAVDPLLVGGVREEGAVRAAAVIGSLAVDAVAAATEDARPARAQPGEVGPDHVLRVGRVGELHPLPDEVEPDLAR